MPNLRTEDRSGGNPESLRYSSPCHPSSNTLVLCVVPLAGRTPPSPSILEGGWAGTPSQPVRLSLHRGGTTAVGWRPTAVGWRPTVGVYSQPPSVGGQPPPAVVPLPTEPPRRLSRTKGRARAEDRADATPAPVQLLRLPRRSATVHGLGLAHPCIGVCCVRECSARGA